jgi:hypothetical protein
MSSGHSPRPALLGPDRYPRPIIRGARGRIRSIGVPIRPLAARCVVGLATILLGAVRRSYAAGHLGLGAVEFSVRLSGRLRAVAARLIATKPRDPSSRRAAGIGIS